MRAMTGLPFNSESPGNEPTRPERAMTVAELAGRIKRALADGLPSKVRVVGEVSNLSDRTHWFFSLKDDGAAMRCVCFASNAKRVGFPMRDGMQVVVTGRVDFYDAQGSVQLYVDTIEPVGQGALELRLRQMIAELKELGYFDLEYKKPLPMMPTRIAVVTSRNAAALQDVINTASRRWPGCRLYLYDVRVQGESAAGEIAEALGRLSKHGEKLGIDAVILTRGGGSIEDLWAFNERVVADAVYKCKLPIVAAIGHETDTTVAELVADARCATPTQAAMTLIPEREALQHQVHQLGQRMAMMVSRQVEHAGQRLASASRHTLFRNPQRLIDQSAQQLDENVRRLRGAMPRRLAVDAATLDALTRQLDSISPDSVLERGYSYTLDADGKVLKHTTDTRAGKRITTVLADGRINSTVDSHSTASAAPKKMKRRRPNKSEAHGPGLFETDNSR